MFNNKKKIEETKTRIAKKKEDLKLLIRDEFNRRQHFREGYGDGVTDYYWEKEHHPFRHVMMQMRILAIFTINKEDELIDKILTESIGWDNLGYAIGFYYFQFDELLAR